jgi:hypothetical protein
VTDGLCGIPSPARPTQLLAPTHVRKQRRRPAGIRDKGEKDQARHGPVTRTTSRSPTRSGPRGAPPPPCRPRPVGTCGLKDVWRFCTVGSAAADGRTNGRRAAGHWRNGGAGALGVGRGSGSGHVGLVAARMSGCLRAAPGCALGVGHKWCCTRAFFFFSKGVLMVLCVELSNLCIVSVVQLYGHG